ncbi:restriction endonuclease subunit S [Pseudoalteromonas sp. AOP31-A2-14]|uniref:restriction endonuclease subunit S n=1 Tax=Pseudoalteromonas TaxID=53246 RepID=UPI0018673A41|nr:restriction endonuclease subunit S [Pseudoalteromonas nigrifaciens]
MNVATPSLRFKTYSKPWEVQALGNLGSFLGGGTPSTENRVYWSGDIPWVSSSDIKEGDFFGINLHRFISEDAIKNSATKKVPENSLLIVSRVGVGKFAVCRHEVCTSQDFTSFTPENCSIDFIAYQLYKNKNRLINLGQGTTIKGFTTGDLASFKLHIPEKGEQQKIADFLTSVDTKISQLTEKHRLLKDYKKGVMQQIFSQKIHFKDDDGNAFPEWNTHELAMLSESGISNGVFNDPKKVGKGFRLINVKDMYKGDSIEYSELTLLDLEPKLFEKNKVKYGDIFFTRSSIVPTGIAFSNVNLSEKEDITFDGHLMKISPNKKLVDPLFLAYYLRSYTPRKTLVSRGKQSTMTTIAQDDIKDIKLNIPALKEQQKIAQFLQSIDKKTSAVNEQIEQTKLFKKGLLQQMFV